MITPPSYLEIPHQPLANNKEVRRWPSDVSYVASTYSGSRPQILERPLVFLNS